MKFELNLEQSERVIRWSHDHDCSITNTGAIGGKITFQFTPTNLGTVEKAICACGKELDVTDYNW